MNQAKIDRHLHEQTSAAQKVYNAVPTTEAWPVHAIRQELSQAGINMPMKTITGCLRCLQKAGLVKEEKELVFIKITASKPALSAVPREIKYEEMPVTEEKPQEETPLEILAQLSKKLESLQSDFETAAIRITEQFDDMEEQMKDVQEFRAFMEKFGLKK